jgi:DNA-binding NarL/FixJ family response regulator
LTADQVTVLLVDDQPLLRTGFRLILGSTPDIIVVGEAEDGEQAVRLTAELRPDVVLMDVRMPRLDGVQATRRIVADGGHSRVLILTTFDLDEYAFARLRAGASGFLLKDVATAELLSGIRSVASGDAVVSPRITRRLLDAHARHLPGTPPAANPLTDRLTTRELEVLRTLASGQSNAEIAATLVLSEATIKTHVTRILSKLELRDRVQAVIYAYENGLSHGNG